MSQQIMKNGWACLKCKTIREHVKKAFKEKKKKYKQLYSVCTSCGRKTFLYGRRDRSARVNKWRVIDAYLRRRVKT